MIGKDDKCRKVLVQRSEPIAYPAAGPGKSRKKKSGCLEQRGRRVHSALAHYVVEKRDVIDVRAKAAAEGLDPDGPQVWERIMEASRG